MIQVTGTVFSSSFYLCIFSLVCLLIEGDKPLYWLNSTIRATILKAPCHEHYTSGLHCPMTPIIGDKHLCSFYETPKIRVLCTSYITPWAAHMIHATGFCCPTALIFSAFSYPQRAVFSFHHLSQFWIIGMGSFTKIVNSFASKSENLSWTIGMGKA